MYQFLLLVLIHYANSNAVVDYGIDLNLVNPYDEESRIVGGREARERQFPYAVALYFRGEYICTASLISRNTVLTAAHCIVHNNQLQLAEDFYGMAGTINRSSSMATRLDFSSVTIHPLYEPRIFANDIAFFKLSHPVSFTDKLSAVCLADENTPLNGYIHGTVAGWGSVTASGSTFPKNLRYTAQKILLHFLCNLRYPSVTNRQLCAQGFGSGICEGDSGGPLVHVNRGRIDTQLAISSYIDDRSECGSLVLGTAVFTRLAAYVDWLKENTEDNDLCLQ